MLPFATTCGSYPVLCPIGAGNSFPAVKHLERVADQLTSVECLGRTVEFFLAQERITLLHSAEWTQLEQTHISVPTYDVEMVCKNRIPQL